MVKHLNECCPFSWQLMRTLLFDQLQFINWKTDEVAQSAESFLIYHKFGHVSNCIYD